MLLKTYEICGKYTECWEQIDNKQIVEIQQGGEQTNRISLLIFFDFRNLQVFRVFFFPSNSLIFAVKMFSICKNSEICPDFLQGQPFVKICHFWLFFFAQQIA